MQLAVSFSQLNEHKKALSCGRKCLYYFTSLANNLKNIFVNGDKLFNITTSTLTDISRNKLKNNTLQHEFLTILEEILRINEFIEKILVYFEQNNIDGINKINLEDLNSFSLLFKEKKFNPDWLPNISIVNFMHVEYLSLKKINHTILFGEIYTETFLSLILMLGATIYFMISTENRFMCIELASNHNTTNNFKIKPIFEKTSFQNIRKTKKFNFR